MGKSQPDPMRGVFRWAFGRVGSHLNQFALGSLGLTALIVLLSNAFALPTNATFRDRALNGLLALLFAAVTILVIAFLYAVVIGPYEQRNALRNRVRHLVQIGNMPAEHLTDLHEYAHAQRELVARNTWNPRLRGALADSFGSHFPELAKSLDEWDHGHDKTIALRGEIMTRAWLQAKAMKLTPEDGEPGGYVDLLNKVAIGFIDINSAEPIWEARGGEFRIVNIGGQQAITTTRGREDEPFAWIGQLQAAFRDTATWPEVLQFNQQSQRLDELRAPLQYRLELIEHDHELERSPNCRLCGSGRPSMAMSGP
jgi:hypothetical protein